MDPDAAAQFLLRAAETLACAVAQHIGGRGLHSSTFQLNLSRF